MVQCIGWFDLPRGALPDFRGIASTQINSHHRVSRPQDCALHPSEPVVAAALISGRLHAHRFDVADGSAAPAFDLKVSLGSVREAHACA